MAVCTDQINVHCQNDIHAFFTNLTYFTIYWTLSLVQVEYINSTINNNRDTMTEWIVFEDAINNYITLNYYQYYDLYKHNSQTYLFIINIYQYTLQHVINTEVLEKTACNEASDNQQGSSWPQRHRCFTCGGGLTSTCPTSRLCCTLRCYHNDGGLQQNATMNNGWRWIFTIKVGSWRDNNNQ